jgi:hypothetical protein
MYSSCSDRSAGSLISTGDTTRASEALITIRKSPINRPYFWAYTVPAA